MHGSLQLDIEGKLDVMVKQGRALYLAGMHALCLFSRLHPPDLDAALRAQDCRRERQG